MRFRLERGAPALRTLSFLVLLPACASGSGEGDEPTGSPTPDPGRVAASDRPAERAAPDSTRLTAVDVTPVASARADGPPEGHAWVVFGADTIVAEVAETAAERAVGLMNRTELPENGGMLFVFDRMEHRTFWMKDTPLDLDVAFMEEGFRIVQIVTMEANSLTLHDSEAPVFAALEVHGGWLAAHGVQVGDVPEVVFRE